MLAQGLVCITDYFNVHTDPTIRNEEGYRKNVDDILTSAANIKQLEDRLKKLLIICRKRNMKISPNKFYVGSSVVFGGTATVGRFQENIFLSPTQQNLEAFLDFPTPSCKKDIHSIMGAAAQMKRWTPGLMLLPTPLHFSGMMTCKKSLTR